MSSQILILRVFLGLLGLLCAHFLGRSIAQAGRSKRRSSQPLAWMVRVAVTLLGVGWLSPFDWVTISVLVLAIVLAALGYWDEVRPKREEDLTETMFPKE